MSILDSIANDDMPSSQTAKDLQRLVVLGSGWAADTLFSSLDRGLYDVICVTPLPVRTYTPALAAVATGSLTLFAALDPTRRRGLRVYSAECTHIDVKRKSIDCKAADGHRTFTLDFDVLVCAVGCSVQDFGTPGVAEHAIFLKTAYDALRIRNRMLECFDAASLPSTSDADKRRLLHFIVVGGGASGVELAAELSDLIKGDLSRLYRDVVSFAQLSVYDVAPAILPGFAKDLQSYAMDFFERSNVRIETEKHIERLEAGLMVVKEQGRVEFGMLIWSTGLDAVPLLKKGIQGVKQEEKSHNLVVDDYLRVLDPQDQPLPDIFAMGDSSTLQSDKLPPVGSVADQQGRYLANLLRRRAKQQALVQFEFKSTTKISYLGNERSVQQKGDDGGKSGRGAWALWREEYSRTLSSKRRLILAFYWLITLLFGRDLVRVD